jgi:hypothetical protein
MADTTKLNDDSAQGPLGTETYEAEHVHQVYQEIAPHFSATRFKVRCPIICLHPGYSHHPLILFLFCHSVQFPVITCLRVRLNPEMIVEQVGSVILSQSPIVHPNPLCLFGGFVYQTD